MFPVRVCSLEERCIKNRAVKGNPPNSARSTKLLGVLHHQLHTNQLISRCSTPIGLITPGNVPFAGPFTCAVRKGYPWDCRFKFVARWSSSKAQLLVMKQRPPTYCLCLFCCARRRIGNELCILPVTVQRPRSKCRSK